MSVACIQDIYKCDTCKSALDEHGRSCRHGMLFPLLLLMGNFKRCMNYEFDAEKVKLQLQKKEASKYSPDKDGIYRGKNAEGVLSCLLKNGDYSIYGYGGTKAVSLTGRQKSGWHLTIPQMTVGWKSSTAKRKRQSGWEKVTQFT